jgi:hypothetical protein
VRSYSFGHMADGTGGLCDDEATTPHLGGARGRGGSVECCMRLSVSCLSRHRGGSAGRRPTSVSGRRALIGGLT